MVMSAHRLAPAGERTSEGMLMRADERASLFEVCKRIIQEQDRDKFTELILELEILLEFFHPAENTNLSSQ